MNKPCNVRPRHAGTIAGAVAALFATTYVPSVQANPSGAQVVSGTVNINSPRAGQMNITQGSSNAIVNWNTFSIGSNEAVTIAQPSAAAALLNRVTGNDPSVLAGRLQANGKVFLVNPAGVIFAPGSSVNVGSMVASTLNISNADFLAGNYHFVGTSAASVSNAGSLTAQAGGTIALLGGAVSNSGTVSARLGTAALGAGNDITLDFAGDGLTTLKINQGAANALIGNTGTLAADGGTVVMSAQTADALAGTVINQQGIVRAQSLAEHNGHIVLDGGTNGVTMVGGTLDATGSAGLTGGTVDVTGYNVALLAGASVDASGAAGGGVVHFGGGSGGTDPTIRNANAIWMSPTASIHADALADGNGGNVVAYSQTVSRLYGTLTAKGGSQGGDGGLIETSGKTLDMTGATIDASAPKGRAGTWLIDPEDIEICSDGSSEACLFGSYPVTEDAPPPPPTMTFGPSSPTTPTTYLPDAQINFELNGGTSVVVKTTDGGITVDGNAAILMAGTANETLTLSASGSIVFNTGASIMATGGALGVVLDANVGGPAPANAVTLNGVTINTNGGQFTIGDVAQSAVSVQNTTINTQSGNISITAESPAGNAVALGYATIATTTGNVTIGGTADASGAGLSMEMSSMTTTAGSIGLTGTATGESAQGINVSDSSIATSTGAITMTGTAYPIPATVEEGAVSVSGVGLGLSNSSVTSTSGPITASGYVYGPTGEYPVAVNASGEGLSMDQSSMGTTSGSISLTGTATTGIATGEMTGVNVSGGYLSNPDAPGATPAAALSTQDGGSISVVGTATAQFAQGVSLDNTTVSVTTGDMGITGTAHANDEGSATGLTLLDTSLTSTTGKIFVSGIADAPDDTAYTNGLSVSGSYTPLQTEAPTPPPAIHSSGGGDIQITGTATGSFGEGIEISGAGILSSSGAITLTGTVTVPASGLAGEGASGVYISAGSSLSTGGNISVTGSVPSTYDGSVGLTLDDSSITSTNGNIKLIGQSVGAASSAASVTGVAIQNSPCYECSQQGAPASITTGSGTLSIYGSGTGTFTEGVLITDGSQITSNNGGTIDIRGTVASPTAGMQNDYGVLLSSGAVSATGSSGTIQIVGSTNTSDPGVAIGLPAPAGSEDSDALFAESPAASVTNNVTISTANPGSIVLGAFNDGTASSLIITQATLSSPGGVLSIIPASVNASSFAITAQDATPITLLGSGGGLSIDPQTFATFASIPNIVLGSSTQTGLITVNGQCASSGSPCVQTRPAFTNNLTLSNPGAGSQGIMLPFGISMPGQTLTLLSAGPVTDPGGIQAANLLLSGPGTFTLTDPQNDVGVLALVNAGNVSFLDSHGFVIGPLTEQSYNSTSGTLTPIDGTQSTLSGNLVAQAATGNIGLNTSLSAGGTVDLVMENGVFTAGGAGALSAGNGWRIWASTWNGETRGNVQPNTAQPNFYGCMFGSGCSWGGTVPTTGDHYVYIQRPTVTITADGKARLAGAPNPVFTYGVSGLINGDTAAGALSGTTTSPATQASIAGQYPIDPNFASGVGYIVNDLPATLTVTQIRDPIALSGLQTFFSSEEQTFVYENNLQGTNICIGSNQPLFSTTPPGDNQDILAVEWKRVRSQPNLNSCMLINGQHGCGDF